MHDVQGQICFNGRMDRADLNCADLKGADLSRAVLKGTKLSDAVMSGAKLIETKLTGAALDHANLSGATLDMINMESCSLTYADFRNSNCVETATISRCDFRGALLQGSTWPPIEAHRCRFKEAQYNRGTRLPCGTVPLDAINTDQLWEKRAQELRRSDEISM